ncbi:MAG: hypothetical protein ABWX87_05290 [Pseudoxanthomonas sp.]|jgi:hypothetical protein
MILTLDIARARHAMRHVLRLARLLESDPQAVLHWYHAQAIAPLGQRTAAQLVADGQAARVIQFLQETLARDAADQHAIARFNARIGQ